MPPTPEGRDFTPADLKAILAQHGQTMRPDATIRYLDRPKPGTGAAVVVLERVEEGRLPEYCTHGYATCTNCEFPCWIGHATEKVLTNGTAYPLCIECAGKILPQSGAVRVDHLHDHRREDGPHG